MNDTVTLTDGTTHVDSGLAKSEARFLRKIIDNPDHKIMVSWELETNNAYRDQYQMSCSCGDRHAGQSWDWGLKGVNADCSIPARSIRIANQHILYHVNEEKRGQPVVEEPRLVAKVHLLRVTHEYWVAHYTSDLGEKMTKDSDWHGNDHWPWIGAIKHSRGWRITLVEKTQEQAIAGVLRRLEKQKQQGNVVEVLDASNSLGIEAPVATIASSVRRLIDDAKGLKPTATPHEIKVILQATDDGMTQLKLLEVLRTDLQRRFDESLDLT